MGEKEVIQRKLDYNFLEGRENTGFISISPILLIYRPFDIGHGKLLQEKKEISTFYPTGLHSLIKKPGPGWKCCSLFFYFPFLCSPAMFILPFLHLFYGTNFVYSNHTLLPLFLSNLFSPLCLVLF